MKISVIMPVYNSEKYLSFSVGSVLAQTYDDWELICVDDGSTDASGKILDDYVVQDARIRVIHQANKGVSAARNAGMKEAVGEMIAFLDADDTFVSNALEVFIEIRKRNGADVIRYNCNFVREHAEDKMAVECPECDEVDVEKMTDSPLRHCNLGGAIVISFEVAQKVCWPSLAQCEDPLFVMRCLRLVGKASFLRCELANYLVRSDSVSHTLSLTAITSTCLYLPQAYDACMQLPCYEQTREDTCRFIASFIDGPLKGGWRKLPRGERAQARCAVLRVQWEMALRDPFFKMPHERLKYDLVFSIGCSCSCSQVLREADLQLLSLPFDWIGDSSLSLRTDYLLKKFDGMLVPERLARMAGDEHDIRHDHYLDRETRLQYFHDYPKGIDPIVAFPEVREKFFRRAERLFSLLKRARSVLVVWMGDIRECAKPTAADICDSLGRFAHQYPQTRFDMLVFELPEKGANGTPQFSYGVNWKRVDFDYLDHSAGLEPWLIRKEAILPFLVPYAIRDYRTLTEKCTFRRRRMKADMRRLAAKGFWDYFLRKMRYRLLRHLEKRLQRKGIILDETL